MTQKQVDIRFLDQRLLEDEALRPKYATAGSAGLDLRACIHEPQLLEPGMVTLIPTGIALMLNDPGIAGLLIPRSGLGHKHGLICGNGLGLLDADYADQLYVSAWNRSGVAYTIQPLERLAQLVIVPVLQVGFNVVNSFDREHRGGGFGSTGKN